MAKPIPTRVHGILDYVSAGTMLALPRLLDWSGPVTTLLSVMAVVVVLYSVITRYELSVAKLLPMKGHLALDAISGLGLIAAAFLLPSNGNGEFVGLIALGVFELGAAMLTDDRSTAPATSAPATARTGVYDAPDTAEEKERAVGVYDNPSR